MEKNATTESNELSYRDLAEKSKKVTDEWEQIMDRNVSSKSVEVSSRNLAEKSEIDCEDNLVYGENRMNHCLHETLNELEQIMQVQDEITSIARKNFKELNEINDTLQEKLQEAEIENENLKRRSKSNEGSLMSSHEHEIHRNSDFYQPIPQKPDWILGWLGSSNGNSIYNTQSIHMYAIYFITSNISLNSWQYAQSWLVAIVSFIVIIWQIVILYFLILDLESMPVPFGTDMTNDSDPCVNFHIEVQFNVVFVLFLFTVILSGDVEETAVEEAILKSRGNQIASQGQSMPMLGLVSFSLRIQRYTFPWYAGTTVFFALVVEAPSVIYTFLNILAVAFVTILDKMVSVFFLTRDQRASADQLVQDSQQYGLGLDIPVSFLWSRMTGIAVTAMIFGLTKALENGLDDACNFFLSDFLSYLIFTVVLPVFTILIPSLVNIYFDRRVQTSGQTMFRALGEFIMNTSAYCFVVLTTIIVMEVSLGDAASSLYSISIHIETIWFWIIVFLLATSLILYCFLYWCTSRIPSISITRTPPAPTAPPPPPPPPISPEYESILSVTNGTTTTNIAGV